MRKAVVSQTLQHSMALKNRIRTVQGGECDRKTIGKTTYRGGKKLAGVTYRKIKERKSRQEEAKAAEEAMEQGAESGKKLIKLKPEQAALAKENGKRQVKAAPRVVKVSGLSQEKIKTQASMQKQQMEKSLQAMQKARAAQMARKSAQASAESGKAVLQVTGKGSKLSVQGITAAIQKGVVALEKWENGLLPEVVHFFWYLF